MLAMAAIPTTPSHLGGDWRKDTSVLPQSRDWIKCWLGRDRAEAALAFLFSALGAGDGRRVCSVPSATCGCPDASDLRAFLRSGIFGECRVLVLEEGCGQTDGAA